MGALFLFQVIRSACKQQNCFPVSSFVICFYKFNVWILTRFGYKMDLFFNDLKGFVFTILKINF